MRPTPRTRRTFTASCAGRCATAGSSRWAFAGPRASRATITATLARHLDEFRPQVVSWWAMGGLTLGLLDAARRRGLPAVAFVHAEWLDWGRWADPWTHAFRGRRSRLVPLVELLTRIPVEPKFAEAARYVFVSEHTRRHALSLGLGLRDTGVAHSGIHAGLPRPGAGKRRGNGAFSTSDAWTRTRGSIPP